MTASGRKTVVQNTEILTASQVQTSGFILRFRKKREKQPTPAKWWKVFCFVVTTIKKLTEIQSILSFPPIAANCLSESGISNLYFFTDICKKAVRAKPSAVRQMEHTDSVWFNFSIIKQKSLGKWLSQLLSNRQTDDLALFPLHTNKSQMSLFYFLPTSNFVCITASRPPEHVVPN